MLTLILRDESLLTDVGGKVEILGSVPRLIDGVTLPANFPPVVGEHPVVRELASGKVIGYRARIAAVDQVTGG